MTDMDMDFSLMKKKKKKKKTPLDFDDEPAADATAGDAAPAEDAPAQSLDVDLDFSLMKKKKKKKKKPMELDETGDAAATDDAPSQAMEDMDLNGEDAADGAAVAGDDDAEDIAEERDYTYQELLDRVFDIMRAKNPDMVTGEKRKFVLKPPQVVRIGAKKTSFVNFTEICKLLHRQPKHLLAFICAELGTSGSVDANNQLIIKGRYQQKQIESVLRRYIKEYVTCHTCRSPETMLQKETRLFFLQCESCGSRCSVASIKSGFQAVTSKRAAQRAKQQ